MRILFFFFITYTTVAFCLPATPAKVRAIYNGLDQRSISKHLAFYELYGNTPEGKKALEDALHLLNAGQIPYPALRAIIDLIHKEPNAETPPIAQEDLAIIRRMAQHLNNRQLKGFNAKTEQEVLSLQPEEIDLARALFITELGSESEIVQRILSYEAMIDLMALQIQAKLPPNPTPEMVIYGISHYIFHEMGFRFPPQSIFSKNIDQYTFLPSVLDSRKGVCLGVSLLYLCLGQRLGVNLEMITPPGHIYVRYRQGEKEINIETTARGIHIDSEEYLSVNTKSLQERSIRDVIGLAHFNQASVYWKNENHLKAISSYEKALKYMPDDPLILELKGYNHILAGDEKTGRELLERVKDYCPDYCVRKDSTTQDYLAGKANVKGLANVFRETEEDREAILKKKDDLEEVIANYPEFRSGILSLASTWMELHRADQALKWLERYHKLDDGDPTVEYYLAALYLERYQHRKAWEHLERAEKITGERGYAPRELRDLRRELSLASPR